LRLTILITRCMQRDLITIRKARWYFIRCCIDDEEVTNRCSNEWHGIVHLLVEELYTSFFTYTDDIVAICRGGRIQLPNEWKKQQYGVIRYPTDFNEPVLRITFARSEHSDRRVVLQGGVVI
jgi:hypothetical protein